VAVRRSALRLLSRLPLPNRLGLRARITLAFATSAALLSALLAITTLAVTRQNLIDQRERTVIREAFLNAGNVRGQLPSEPEDADELQDVLSSVATPSGSQPVVRVENDNGTDLWLALDTQFGESALPESLRRTVAEGTPATMRFELDGDAQLAVGVPLETPGGLAVDASYFEIVSLDDLVDTIRSLGVALTGGALVTTLAGALGGWWVSRRTLRPLANVSAAAEAIAGGRLDTRLETSADPELRGLVSSFNHMAQALEDRIERDGRFASDVSHELRSPLTTLSASIEVLRSRLDEMPDDSARAAIELMDADVARFQQLVEDLLEISRFDAGAARLTLEGLKLSVLVRQAVGSTRHPVPVTMAPELEDLVVRVDKRRLLRVIANLLDNAEKYAGGPTAVTLQRFDGVVQIAIEDAGPGVPADEQDVVFHRFSRGLSGRARTGAEGVGLGLSLVAEHVALHGGRTWVSERLDGSSGARFVVELPVVSA
jgi:signal transduction histidine kinase